MSDVLIKGIEMPKKGESVTITLFWDGAWCNYNDIEPHGKVIELPPHGRLIDADSIKKTLSAVSGEQRQWFYSEVGQVIDDAPTVVEATE